MDNAAAGERQARARILRNCARLAAKAAEVIQKRPEEAWKAIDLKKNRCVMSREHNGGCAIALNFSPAITDNDLWTMDNAQELRSIANIVSVAEQTMRDNHTICRRAIEDLGFSMDDVSRWGTLTASCLSQVQRRHDSAETRAGAVHELMWLAEEFDERAAKEIQDAD